MTTLRKAVWLACLIAAEGALLGQNNGPTTLHVYVNTIQVPVLVLGKNRQPVGPIATNRFSVRLDSGPWFPATHTRLEGDDPISLAILLDVRGYSARLMGKMGDEMAGLAPNWLNPRDRVSVYSLDCDLTRSAFDLPAEPSILKRAVDNALMDWRSGTVKRGNRCQQSVHLWDALVDATKELRELPGRRVILVVTDGNDEGSRYTWKELVADFAQRTSVSVFAVSPAETPILAPDPLTEVCELSGGLVLTVGQADSLGKTLQRFTSILRRRYIVEFPRAYNATSGFHVLGIKIHDGTDYFIRSTGISVPLPDPTLARDPTTVPPDSAHEPEMGTHKVLTPN